MPLGVVVDQRDDTPSPAQDGWPPWVEKYLLPYLREPAGWPITFAVVGHASVLQALVGLAAWRSQHPAFLFLVAAYVVMTLTPIRTEYRCTGTFGIITKLVIGMWLSTLGVAWWAGRSGYF